VALLPAFRLDLLLPQALLILMLMPLSMLTQS
jgi:hypothetical protein